MNNEPSANIRSLSVNNIQSPHAAAGSWQASRPQPAKRMYFQPRPIKRERRFLKKLELPLLLAGGMIGGFLADNIVVGLALLTIYGIVAFVTRIPSRTTFALALLLLIAISVLLLVKPNPQLIQNFASYTFVLLLIGVITLGRETKMPKRTRRKYRR